jgi:GWxTD domain-containing protein
MTGELVNLIRKTVLIALFAASTVSAQSSSHEAVARAVDAINERRFSDAISNLQAAISSARNIVDMRQRNDVLAALHFYSAIAFLELNDEESTIAELRHYVELRDPDEKVDESKYSHRFGELYRHVLSTPRVEVGTPFDRIYPMPETVGATFAETPIRFWERSSEFTLLATAGEKNQWQTLTSDEARREFIAIFWAVRDLRPETAENEFRLELQRRIAYADRVFGTSTQRGSLTDRGRVFALLGVPDAIEIKHDVMSDSGDTPLLGSEAGDKQSKLTAVQSRVMADKASSRRRPAAERWIYSPQRVPVNVPAGGVSYTFIHREGESVVLTAEFFAAKALRDVTYLKRK